MYPTKEEPGLGAFVASQVTSLQKLGTQVDVCFLDVRRSKWELIRGVSHIRRAVHTGQYDLIHAHFGYNGIPACLQNQLPVVISYCGTDLNHPMLRPISKWVARRADACIVKSESLQTLLGHPATVIPNGVDMDRFQPGNKQEARRRLGLSSNKQYALFISTDLSRPEKRFELAKQAIQKAGMDLLLFNNRPQDELPTFFNAADALILSSSYEGSPNVVKEALACDLPVVSTNVGDVQTLLDGVRNSCICDGTPDSLASGLKAIVQDGHPSSGREKIAYLSADAIAHRVLSIYHTALNRREGQ